MTENTVMLAAAHEEVGYRDPEWHPPPRGKRLLILTGGNVAILGPWTEGVGYLAWSYLPRSTILRGQGLQNSLDAMEQNYLSAMAQNARDALDALKELDRKLGLDYAPPLRWPHDDMGTYCEE